MLAVVDNGPIGDFDSVVAAPETEPIAKRSIPLPEAWGFFVIPFVWTAIFVFSGLAEAPLAEQENNHGYDFPGGQSVLPPFPHQWQSQPKLTDIAPATAEIP